MAAPSAPLSPLPTAVSPTFPSDVTSTPPQASSPPLLPQGEGLPHRERRSSQKRVAGPSATHERYPSTTGLPPPAPPPLALAPGPPRVAPPAATRPFIAYDPSLIIPPFNPNKRRSGGHPIAAGSASAPATAPPSSAPSRRESVLGPAPTQFSAQQQQHYQQQWAHLQQQQALAQQQQQQQQQQAPPTGRSQQRPVSLMPTASRPAAPYEGSSSPYHAFYPSATTPSTAVPAGTGASVSSRSRQSVVYFPPAAAATAAAAASPHSASGGAPAAASAAHLAAGGQGPYPHLYTPHPMPRQKVYFGPYILLQTLGEGEFGKVKLGVHGERWGEDVAIKLIKRGNVDTVQRGEKVRREIEVLKMVRHPNIVRLYDVIETEKYIGIVLEYASGGELFDHILAHRYLKERDASRLFAQLVSGVSYLHAKGVVHRDLKLENLLLDRNRNVIVTDFGFANRFRDARTDLMATSCGSPCYAAPELVVSDGKYVGTAVDVWSCGVILYAMLAGYLPYDDDPANPEGDNINLLYRYILSTPLTFPDWISDEPRGLLLEMLVADPLQRCTIGDVTRHSWLRRYAPAFDKSVEELEYQAQEMERHKRQALELQRQWLVAQQQQQALAAQGLLAPSMTRSQTATSGMAGPSRGLPHGQTAPAGHRHLAASMGPPGVGAPQALPPHPLVGGVPRPISSSNPADAAVVAATVAGQTQPPRSGMVTSASTSAVSAPLAQHGFEHYSLVPSSPASTPTPASASPAALQDPLLAAPLSPSAPPSPIPAGANSGGSATVPPPPEPPVSPRTRTSSTGVIIPPFSGARSSNPNRRSGAYTVSSSPPTTQTEFASANAGPFSFAAAAAAGPASVPMTASLSAPAATGPRSSLSGGTRAGGGAELPALSEDALMHDRTPSPSLAGGSGSVASAPSSAPPSRASSTTRRPSTTTTTDVETEAAAQRRRKAAHRVTLQIEYDPTASAGGAAYTTTRRRGASREPGLPTAVEGLGIEALPLPLVPPLPLAPEVEALEQNRQAPEQSRLEVPSSRGTAAMGRGAPSPSPSDSAVSVSTTTETHQGEDIVMQPVAVDDDEPTVTLGRNQQEVPLPAPVPFPTETAALLPPPRKRKSSGSPTASIRPNEVPLPPTPTTTTSTSTSTSASTATAIPAPGTDETVGPQRPQAKTSGSSTHAAITSPHPHAPPARPTSATSHASRHRHTASADRFSLRSLLGSSTNLPLSAGPAPPVPPVPSKDVPLALDEVTNRRKASRRQKAMSLQPFRQSVSSKLPKGARANVDRTLAASAGAGQGSATAARERASAIHAQGETIQPPPIATAMSHGASSRPAPSGRADSGSSAAAAKRFSTSTDLEANWGSSSATTTTTTTTAGPTPGGKAKAVMDWFRRKSARHDATALAPPPPLPVEFDRSPLPLGPPVATARPTTAPTAHNGPSPSRDELVKQDNPSVVVTQPLRPGPAADPAAAVEQQDSAPNNQLSRRTASTLGSSVGSSSSVAPQPQPPQQVLGPSPPAFVPTKLRFHQGALDKNAVTYRAPNAVLTDIKQALWNMGVEMALEGDYKIKCVRKSRKKALAASSGPGGGFTGAGLSGSVAAGPGALDRRNSLASSTTLAPSPSLGFRSLFGGAKKQQAVGSATPTPSSPNFSIPGTPSTPQDYAFDLLSSPMTTSVSQFSMLSLASPQPLPVYGGDKSADAGDEVRFVVELTRVKNLDGLYCVDVKRIKGTAWSYKHVYDQLVGSLELGPSI